MVGVQKRVYGGIYHIHSAIFIENLYTPCLLYKTVAFTFRINFLPIAKILCVFYDRNTVAWKNNKTNFYNDINGWLKKRFMYLSEKLCHTLVDDENVLINCVYFLFIFRQTNVKKTLCTRPEECSLGIRKITHNRVKISTEPGS